MYNVVLLSFQTSQTKHVIIMADTVQLSTFYCGQRLGHYTKFCNSDICNTGSPLQQHYFRRSEPSLLFFVGIFRQNLGRDAVCCPSC